MKRVSVELCKDGRICVDINGVNVNELLYVIKLLELKAMKFISDREQEQNDES